MRRPGRGRSSTSRSRRPTTAMRGRAVRRATTATSFGLAPPSKFSAVSLGLRVTPSEDLNATVRAEYDTKFRAIRTIGAQGSYSGRRCAERERRLEPAAVHPGPAGLQRPARRQPLPQRPTPTSASPEPVGGSVSFNYDVKHKMLPAAAIRRILQRAVLRLRHRVPELQLRGRVVRGLSSARGAGPADQFHDHARGPRIVRELLRRRPGRNDGDAVAARGRSEASRPGTSNRERRCATRTHDLNHDHP